MKIQVIIQYIINSTLLMVPYLLELHRHQVIQVALHYIYIQGLEHIL